MSKEIIDSNRLFVDDPQSILERTLVAEYLLCNGYLFCDLDDLPYQQANALIREALQFAARRIAEITPEIMFSPIIRIPFSLN